MRPLLRPVLGLVGLVALLVACSSDNERDRSGGAITDPHTASALADYWNAGDQAGSSLASVDDSWAAFATLAADPSRSAIQAREAARGFADACSVASAHLTDWADLERRIHAYGGAKSEIDADSRAAAAATLTAAATAVLGAGESLLVSWEVLGGIASLRSALADPERTVPVTGWLADTLSARLDARDQLVLEAIGADDDHGGLLPLGQIPGVDPAGRQDGYLDLGDDHPVKLACRAAAPRWDAGERTTSLALLDRVARGRLRWFSEVGAGGPTLADLPGHLSALDDAGTVHQLTLDLRDGTSGNPVSGGSMILIRRLGQPSEQPRLALLQGAVAQCLLDLPAGRYDVLAMASGWARAVAADLTTDDDLVVTLPMTHLIDGALLFDGIVAPAMAGAGGRVNLSAPAASALGEPLAFDWDVRGPGVTDLIGAGARATFVPAAAGRYTAEVTVSDLSGNAVTDSVLIDVQPFAVSVVRTDFVVEQIADLRFNPGEVDTLQLWVANHGDSTVVGVPSLRGKHGIDVDLTDVPWTLSAGRQTRWNVVVPIPADYDQDRAYLDFGFTVDGVTLVQELEYPVEFYVDLDFIRSPQTSRVLTISGTVANPALATAELVIDRDLDAVYQMPLTRGAFEQVVIVPGSLETRRIRLTVSAESGSRREEARAGFMAAIAPADFRATLYWDTDGTDVDLWVTDPEGEKCYFANRTTASGLKLDVDDVNGYGPENITGESDLPAGDYLVQLHYFSDHGTGLASDCTVVITLHEGTAEETIEEYRQVLTDNQVWTVCTVTWNGDAVERVQPGDLSPLFEEADRTQDRIRTDLLLPIMTDGQIPSGEALVQANASYNGASDDLARLLGDLLTGGARGYFELLGLELEPSFVVTVKPDRELKRLSIAMQVREDFRAGITNREIAFGELEQFYPNMDTETLDDWLAEANALPPADDRPSGSFANAEL